MTPTKKTALVIGATGKIGWAVCTELARAGYAVGIHYFRSGQQAAELAAQVGRVSPGPVLIKANVGVAKECDALVEQAHRELGRIDALVHCASVFDETPLADVSVKEWEKLMAINLRAPFFISRAVGLMMKEEKRDGRIVHFSDIAARRPYGDHLPYCMAKAALEAMVAGLAVRLSPEVKVNAIAPYIAKMPAELSDDDKLMVGRIPLRRPTEPSEVANLVRMLISDTSTVTGQVITIDGGRSLTW